MKEIISLVFSKSAIKQQFRARENTSSFLLFVLAAKKSLSNVSEGEQNPQSC